MDYLHEDYCATIEKISNLLSHGEITFDLLYAILVPRAVLITECLVSGALRCMKLLSASNTPQAPCYEIRCESVDVIDQTPMPGAPGHAVMPLDNFSPTGADTSFGRVLHMINLPYFEGTIKIHELDIYPLQYHPQAKNVTEILAARGRKWVSLRGIHHMQYKGSGFRMINCRAHKHNVSFNLLIDDVVSRGLAVYITNYD